MSPKTVVQNKIIRQEKKDLILRTALIVFAQEGYHASSVNKIADKANISKGLLYTYFESKEDLLNIWIPFFRVENATQRQLSSKGSGIGLYLVSEILKAHNADYSITNVKNGVKASFSINKTISDNKK